MRTSSLPFVETLSSDQPGFNLNALLDAFENSKISFNSLIDSYLVQFIDIIPLSWTFLEATEKNVSWASSAATIQVGSAIN